MDPILLGEAVRVAGADERPLVLLAAVDVLSAAEGRAPSVERLRFLALPQKSESQPDDEEEVAIIEASIRDDAPPSFAAQTLGLLTSPV